MMASILDKLDSLGDQHPHRLLYSYIDVHGNPIGGYTYESFLHRTKVIAGHLRKEHGFAAARPSAARLPAGARNDLRVFWLRARGIDPRPRLSPQFSWLPGRAVQDGPHRQGLPGERRSDQQRLSRIVEDESCPQRSRGIGSRRRLHFRPALGGDGRLRRSGSERKFNGASDNGSGTAHSKILFLQYTSGSTRDPKGVMVTHENILHNCPLSDRPSAPIVVSWLPQYHDMGLIGCYLYPALKGGTTYGFAPTDFIQRRLCGLTQSRPTGRAPRPRLTSRTTIACARAGIRRRVLKAAI